MDNFADNRITDNTCGDTVISAGKLRAVISPLGAQIRELYYGDIQVAKDGITVGRYANRIKDGVLTVNGQSFRLDVNENGNCLHGGPEGFGKRIWTVSAKSENRAELSLVSEDGDQGFPGRLSVKVTYTLSDDGSLFIDYSAVSDKDTVVNLTNHSYFNLNGKGPAEAHRLRIDAVYITETDAQLIPTGRLIPVEGTRFNFRKERGFDPGHDENYVLSGEGVRLAACLTGKQSGLSMDVYTDQPGMQLYNTETHICLETQHFPDSPGHPEFPSVLLKAGEEFRSQTVYSFRKQDR